VAAWAAVTTRPRRGFALEPARAERENPSDLGQVLAQVERRRPRRGNDPVRVDRRAHVGQASDVFRPVPHRVVRHVDDVVAPADAVRQDGGDARHRVRAAIDDAVEVDEQQQTTEKGRHGTEIVPARARRPISFFATSDSRWLRPTATIAAAARPSQRGIALGRNDRDSGSER
jgi:hypothetical protein